MTIGGRGNGPGLADLTLAVRDPSGAGRGGRTCLVGRRTNPPLQVQRVLYLDEALPDMAFVCLCNPTAGVLQGDTLEIRVRVKTGARAHISTQAATKVFTMPEGAARLDTCLDIDQGAYLEYLPDPLIPFRGARLAQHTSITVAPGASLVYGEVIASGRTARGESLAYSELQYRLDVRTPDGRPIVHEAYRLTPATRSPRQRGVLGVAELGPGTIGAGRAMGTLLVVSQEVSPELLRQRVREALEQIEPGQDATAGVSLLAGGQGVGVKVLAGETASAQAAVRQAWAAARRCILGVGPPPPRK